ncbi:BH0838 [Halalkalibacterium halodurans C-125]|uniref:BH0838 protein n=1 Tax=Halalkalibacterium halodurans (strain ATCC BAA-125 / DSM 18197 / FERM 7344 / JCM 9153 / C-125) TaxID=272558 RepID=Q9KEL4_HALH5|nr:BH0838 [Halalkalibacterium halodurans C-125]
MKDTVLANPAVIYE